jgi:cytochrome P450
VGLVDAAGSSNATAPLSDNTGRTQPARSPRSGCRVRWYCRASAVAPGEGEPVGQIHVVYDPTTAAFQTDMHEVYSELRDRYPLYVDAKGTYVLSRFDDVWRAVHDWETFSSDHVAEAAQQLPSMIYMDPPRHAALRALVSRAFTPKRVADLEPRVREVARQLIAGVDRRFDLAHEFAAPLPSIIMGELIGVPEEHRESFRTWTEAFIEVTGPEDIAGRVQNIYELFGTLLDERRRHPADDLMSALLAAEVDGVRLTDEELVGFCFLLLIAGNDTTTTLIGNGAELLARHPDQQAVLAHNPTLIPGAVIPRGARVMLLWGAANLDDREFAEPARFDIARNPKRHLGFGHGIHFCIGASLARLEARIAFEELLVHAPQFALAGEPVRFVSNWARAWQVLPVDAGPAMARAG